MQRKAGALVGENGPSMGRHCGVSRCMYCMYILGEYIYMWVPRISTAMMSPILLISLLIRPSGETLVSLMTRMTHDE